MSTTKTSPLSQKLREKAKMIERLLEEYSVLRYGDKEYRESKGEKGTPPQITVISSPRAIFELEESSAEADCAERNSEGEEKTEEKTEKKEEKKAVNPLIGALRDLGEIEEKDVKNFDLENRYKIIRDLGVREQYNCSALVRWVPRLAAQLTYILETREMYSSEIKAVYPELLNDLEIARSTCDQLAYTLSKQNGVLTSNQYSELLVKLLHYTKVAQQAALQLADHHEEFMSAEYSPLESGPAIEWVEKAGIPRGEEEKPKEGSA